MSAPSPTPTNPEAMPPPPPPAPGGGYYHYAAGPQPPNVFKGGADGQVVIVAGTAPPPTAGPVPVGYYAGPPPPNYPYQPAPYGQYPPAPFAVAGGAAAPVRPTLTLSDTCAAIANPHERLNRASTNFNKLNEYRGYTYAIAFIFAIVGVATPLLTISEKGSYGSATIDIGYFEMVQSQYDSDGTRTSRVVTKVSNFECKPTKSRFQAAAAFAIAAIVSSFVAMITALADSPHRRFLSFDILQKNIPSMGVAGAVASVSTVTSLLLAFSLICAYYNSQTPSSCGGSGGKSPSDNGFEIAVGLALTITAFVIVAVAELARFYLVRSGWVLRINEVDPTYYAVGAAAAVVVGQPNPQQQQQFAAYPGVVAGGDQNALYQQQQQYAHQHAHRPPTNGASLLPPPTGSLTLGDTFTATIRPYDRLDVKSAAYSRMNELRAAVYVLILFATVIALATVLFTFSKVDGSIETKVTFSFFEQVITNKYEGQMYEQKIKINNSSCDAIKHSIHASLAFTIMALITALPAAFFALLDSQRNTWFISCVPNVLTQNYPRTCQISAVVYFITELSVSLAFVIALNLYSNGSCDQPMNVSKTLSELGYDLGVGLILLIAAAALCMAFGLGRFAAIMCRYVPSLGQEGHPMSNDSSALGEALMTSNSNAHAGTPHHYVAGPSSLDGGRQMTTVMPHATNPDGTPVVMREGQQAVPIVFRAEGEQPPPGFIPAENGQLPPQYFGVPQEGLPEGYVPPSDATAHPAKA